MRILIECSCNVPYELECEPVDGKLDGTVACPTCGGDGTEMANWIIAQQLTPAPAPVADAKPEPVKIGLVSAATEESALPKSCFRHTDQPLAAFCFMCKKPICERCMEQFGYFCSAYCIGEADRKRMDIPVYEKQFSVVSEKKHKRAKLIGLGITALVLALIGLWVWYSFVGSRPRIMFSLDLGRGHAVGFCKFVGPHQALLQTEKELRLYDVKSGNLLWSANLTPFQQAPEAQAEVQEALKTMKTKQGDSAAMEEVMKQAAELSAAAWSGYGAGGTHVHVNGNDVWVTFPTMLVRFDLHTGQQKSKVPITGTMLSASFSDSAVVVSSRQKPNFQTMTRVLLSDGAATTKEVAVAPPEFWTDPATAGPAGDFESTSSRVTLEKVRSELIGTGEDAVHLDVKLVKPHIVTVETIKPQTPGTGLSGEVSAGNQAAAIEDVLNDLSRSRGGGMRKEDQSQYAVTLRRVLDDSATEWSSEVTGRPTLFTFKTVDVLLAGQTMHVFDKKNHGLWEAKLTYPIAERFTAGYGVDEEASKEPGLEAGDTLYFWDKGVLRAYDLRTGNVRWSLPTVGVSGIQVDNKGMLYVSTTSAGPETIQYSSQVNIRDKVVSIILKVDPSSGKILWRVEKLADHCYPSGKFLYFVRSHISGFSALSSMMSGGGDTTVHFYVDRINPRTGKLVWEYYRPEPAVTADFQDNLILLRFADRLEALRYLTL